MTRHATIKTTHLPSTPKQGMIELKIEKIIKCLDLLRAKKTFIRKKLDHTAVSAIKALSVTP